MLDHPHVSRRKISALDGRQILGVRIVYDQQIFPPDTYIDVRSSKVSSKVRIAS
jgi:hypothetical protein